MNQMNQMDHVLSKILWGQLRTLGLFSEARGAIADLKTRYGIQETYGKWLDATLPFLVQGQYITCENDTYTVVDPAPVDVKALWDGWDQQKLVWVANPDAKAQVILVETMLRALPDILIRKKLATDIMFPRSSMELVEGVYKGNPVADYFNDVLAQMLVAALDELRNQNPAAQVRIFEIGAGSGGTSERLFAKLQDYWENIEEYCYTDISRAFLQYAEKKFGVNLPRLSYAIFNVEQHPARQGIQVGAYDIVIAANVLHATRNIKQTLKHTKALLRKNGLLLLNEISTNTLFTHLTFGLLEGWWVYEDPALRIPGCPGLSPETWQALLDGEGFRSIFFPAEASHELGQQIVVAESDGVVRLEQDVPQERGDQRQQLNTHRQSRPVSRVEKRGGGVNDQAIEEYVKRELLEKVAETLNMKQEQINPDSSFADYGLDSILGVNLVKTISETFNIDFQTTDLFDYSTIHQLTQHIASTYKDVIAQKLRQHAEPFEVQETMPESAQPRPGQQARMVHEQDLPQLAVRPMQGEPIAIVGMSGRFAQSRDVHELWEHLANGDELITRISRWNLAQYYPEGATYCDYGSFLDDIDQFDPLFFNISGLEATYMDPQQRIFLQEAWRALEDAGYAGSDIAGTHCGVYVGCAAGDYTALFTGDPPPQALWGSLNSAVAARISYYLDLQGPALTVDTACSSSLVAIHLACQGLWSGETEMALAGGIYIQTTPQYYLLANRAGMLSPTGHCYTFDARADGMVPGEAVGVVVLKRLRDAQASGDHIYGVIRGSGINQDGTTNGITAPSLKSQERLERSVYDRFGIHPRDIQMVEAHGTGTPLGDPIEYQAISRAFRQYTDQKEYCAIGSMKTNVGHTQLASGVAGLIKILLSLKHQQIPPSLHFEQGNAAIQFHESPFYVNTELKPWESQPGTRRLAAISSFGASGTNAHLVIEEAPAPVRQHAARPGYLIVLSARSPEQVRQQVERLVAFCEREPGSDLGNIAYTLMRGRKHFKHRLACVVQSLEELVVALRTWLEKGQAAQVMTAEAREAERFALKRYGNQCIQDSQHIQQTNDYLEQLLTIADLYVQGYKLDYDQLFADGYTRMPLPTYPFAQERYWVDEKQTEISHAPAIRETIAPPVLHPLLQQNTSDLLEQRFSSTFTGHEPFLPVRTVQGQRVLPDVACLEMARAAIALATGNVDEREQKFRLQQLVWSGQAPLGSDPLHISLIPESDDRLTYEIYALPQQSDAEPLVYHHGQAVLHTYDGAPPTCDLAAIQAECQGRLFSAQEWSEALAGGGMGEQAHDQIIEALFSGPDLVLARIAAPASLLEPWPVAALPPRLLDAVVQTTQGLALASERPLQPVWLAALESVEIFGPCPSQMWAVLRARQGDQTCLDLDLCDDQGIVWLRMAGLTVQTQEVAAVHASASTSPSNPVSVLQSEKTELLTFEEVWQRQPAAPLSASSGSPRTLVCLLSQPAARQEVIDVLHGLDPACTPIFLAQGNDEAPADPHVYPVDPANRGSIRRALEEIGRIYGQIDALLYLWPLEYIELRSDPQALLLLLQDLVAAQVKAQRLLWVGPFADGLQRSEVEAWIGLERSVGLLLPQMQVAGVYGAAREQGQTVQIKAWMHRLWQEMHQPTMRSVLYEGESRSLSQIRPIALTEGRNLLRRNGTYLITGGLGGLGYLLGRHLARHYGARLILVGRSGLDTERQARINALEQAGGQVVYVQADIADPVALRAGISQGRGRFGAIHGVIHAAGVSSRQTVLEKRADQFREVLMPKIEGTQVLDDVLGDEDELDFLCCFSSSAAILGDFGACDYAIGNRFQMGYGRYREELRQRGERSGRTVVINWPLWKDGGMQVGDQEQTRMYLASSGQRFLETDEGLKLFEQILGQGSVQTLVLAGQSERIQRFLGLAEKEHGSSQNQKLQGENEKVRGGRRPEMKGWSVEQCLEWDLKELVGQTLKLERDRLDAEANLTDFGFDSISLTELAQALGRRYGLELTPALFFGYPTLKRLISYFLTEHAELFHAYYREEALQVSQNKRHEKQRIVDHPKRQRRHRGTSRFIIGRATRIEQEEPIAIIGMSGRFPQARTIDELWTILAEGQDVVQEPPEGRFPGNDGQRWKGGWVPGVDEFDPLFFGISPREAETLDPRQRLLLQEAWRALEDAGYGATQIAGGKIGMFVGVENGDYQFLVGMNAPITSNHDGILAARLAYCLNLNGPVMSINTACSSGLVAAHQASLSLRNHECDTAIVAGVNLMLYAGTIAAINQAGMLSQDGRCFAFDKRANGMVPGEAVAVVVLKRLAKAVADGDPIYAVIKGSGINYDGKTNGITAPNGVAQTELLKSVYQKYRIHPEHIDYVVAHGTGTRLGDPIEVNALYDAFKSFTQKQGYCAITSTKTNFGHTFAASGLVSLISLVQALRHEIIPASLHCEEENDFIVWKDSPFYVNKTAKAWPERADRPRCGAVSAFGVSGTNAHLVVESYVPETSRARDDQHPYYLLTLSARTEEGLQIKINDLIDVLQHGKHEQQDLLLMSYTLMAGRQHFKHRCAVIAQSPEDALLVLQHVGTGEKLPNLFRGSVAQDFTGHKAMHQYMQDMAIQARDGKGNSGRYLEILQVLADLYCQGYETPWMQLYEAGRPPRIHLPTYPFTRGHYWVRPSIPPVEIVPEKQQTVASTLSVGEKKENESRVEKRSIHLQQVIAGNGESKQEKPQVSLALPTDNGASASPSVLDIRGPQVLEKPTGIALHPVAISSAPPIEPRKPRVTLSPITAPITAVEPQPVVPSAPKGFAEETLVEELALSLAEALAMDRSDIDVKSNFIDLGLDSIIGVEWVQTINKKYGLALAAGALYDYPNIQALARYLSDHLDPQEHQVLSPLTHEYPPEETDTQIEQPPREAPGDVEGPPATRESTVLVSLDNSSTETLQEELALILAEALAMDRSDISLDMNFIDLGLDSIIGVEWIQTINKKYGLSLTANILYDYPNLRSFASFLTNERRKQHGAAQPALPQVRPPASLQDLIQRVQQGEMDAAQADLLFQQLAKMPDLNMPALSDGR